MAWSTAKEGGPSQTAAAVQSIHRGEQLRVCSRSVASVRLLGLSGNCGAMGTKIPPLPKPTSMVEALVLLAILSMKCGEHCPCLAKSPKSSRLHMARVGALWSSRTTIRDAAMQQHSPTWCCERGARGTRELVEPAARALRMRRPSPLCPAPRSERKVARATSVNPRNVIH